ncbi:hypothetical protein JYK02_09980 [Corallococcus macrosporus]|uniref:Uncharacterized protein n=1 Tax=Corallococcus macrosporus TaxID=35 RepID=A0ABS3D860_9BACT|nr:hypothetical protein [Corallococcus macrosporus]MBN8227839.1 hypothetical protein [Corallococcus macrosporus]
MSRPEGFDRHVYRSLPVVGDAFDLLVGNWQCFSVAFEHARHIAATHGVDGDLGLLLLHRHHEVGTEEFMLETPDVLSSGQRALTTSVTPMNRAAAVEFVPARWALSACSLDEPFDAPLEYSCDAGAIGAYRRVARHPDVFRHIGEMLRKLGLDGVLGVTTLPRTWLLGDGVTGFVERTDVERQASVLCARQDEPLESGEYIPTAWSLARTFMSTCLPEYSCFAWCIGRGEGRHETPHDRRQTSHRSGDWA